MMLIALGEHWNCGKRKGASYKITGYGQPNGGFFEAGNTLTLK